MIKLFNYLTDKFSLAWQFVKFCMVGLTNLAVYLAVYWILTRLVHLHYIIASIGGFGVAVTWSFFINRKWTFKHEIGNSKKQYVTFFTANVISMCVNLVLLTFFIEILHIYDLYAQLIGSVIVAFFNFGLNRFWTFRRIKEVV